MPMPRKRFAARPFSRILVLGVLLLSLVATSGCTVSRGQELTVSAAASLAGVLTDLARRYEGEKGGVPVKFNLGSSGALARQIAAGAPVDLFISADPIYVDDLVARGLLLPGVDLAGNELVLVVPAGSGRVRGFKDLAGAGVKRLAMGIPEVVPAGRYGQEVLQHLGLWEQVRTKLVPAKDVRQVLTYVAGGEVDAGLVYATDAAANAAVKVVAAAPPGSHKPIVYRAAVVKESPRQTEAARFLDFLGSEEAKAVWRRYGFTAD